MTVGELIEKLKSYDPSWEILREDDGTWVDIDSIDTWDERRQVIID